MVTLRNDFESNTLQDKDRSKNSHQVLNNYSTTAQENDENYYDDDLYDYYNRTHDTTHPETYAQAGRFEDVNRRFERKDTPSFYTNNAEYGQYEDQHDNQNGDYADDLKYEDILYHGEDDEEEEKPQRPQRSLSPKSQHSSRNQESNRNLQSVKSLQKPHSPNPQQAHLSPNKKHFENKFFIEKRPNDLSSDSPSSEQYEYQKSHSQLSSYPDQQKYAPRSRNHQPLFIEQLVQKNIGAKQLPQDKSYQHEYLSQSNRAQYSDSPMSLTPLADSHSQSVTINVLAQQIAALQKQVDSAQQLTRVPQKQSDMANVNSPSSASIVNKTAESFTSKQSPNSLINQKLDEMNNKREIEALLEFVPPEQQKKLLMELLLSKQKQPEPPQPEQIISNWKPVISQIPQRQQQQVPTVSQILSNSIQQIPSKRTPHESTPPKNQSGILQRNQSNRQINKEERVSSTVSVAEIEKAKRKHEEKMMDDLIRKQEITIKNLQMERSLNKIAKTSPQRLQNEGPKASFSPPKYVQQFHSQHQEQQGRAQQSQSVQIEQQISKKPRMKWGEQPQQKFQQQSQQLPHQDQDTIPAKKISQISRNQDEEEELAEIKRRLRSDFNNYLQQSQLSSYPNRQQKIPTENTPTNSQNIQPSAQSRQFKQAEQQLQNKQYSKWEIPVEQKANKSQARSRTPSPYREEKAKHQNPIHFEVRFSAKRGDLALKKHIESEQRRHDRSVDAQKRARSIPKTKEELVLIRKELLHQTRVSNSNAQSQAEFTNIRSNPSKGNLFDDSEQFMHQQQKNPSKAVKDPPPELLNRLIYGLKAKVEKKDYQKLTMKNYEQLPEIKRKKEEEKKRMEQVERIRVKKEYEQVIT